MPQPPAGELRRAEARGGGVEEGAHQPFPRRGPRVGVMGSGETGGREEGERDEGGEAAPDQPVQDASVVVKSGASSARSQVAPRRSGSRARASLRSARRRSAPRRRRRARLPWCRACAVARILEPVGVEHADGVELARGREAPWLRSRETDAGSAAPRPAARWRREARRRRAPSPSLRAWLRPPARQHGRRRGYRDTPGGNAAGGALVSPPGPAPSSRAALPSRRPRRAAAARVRRRRAPGLRLGGRALQTRPCPSPPPIARQRHASLRNLGHVLPNGIELPASRP
jgi:hypothetical protein